MSEERISSDTLRLLTSFYGSMVRQLERLAAEERPDLTPEEMARAADLRLAAEAARQILRSSPKVTREGIYELLELEQPGLSYEALLKRWKRHRPHPIRLRDILAAASD